MRLTCRWLAVGLLFGSVACGQGGGEQLAAEGLDCNGPVLSEQSAIRDVPGGPGTPREALETWLPSTFDGLSAQNFVEADAEGDSPAGSVPGTTFYHRQGEEITLEVHTQLVGDSYYVVSWRGCDGYLSGKLAGEEGN